MAWVGVIAHHPSGTATGQVVARWYIIPDKSDWGQIVDWVVRQALPAYVPDALRRVRSPLFHDPLLLTSAESAAEQALADLESRYAQERAALEVRIKDARAEAGPIREALLYGTGASLETAVRTVLDAAGFQTVKLDQVLGGTKSADVLAIRGGRRVLVEVKSDWERIRNLLLGGTAEEIQSPADGAAIKSPASENASVDGSSTVHREIHQLTSG